ncbi:MAG TPA: molybdopterin-guanine dinucleotide biosynthesis protein B, partial [Thermoplasmatales archaeon]|nr:molybdopterin-guanine dinucleotide biosynthesis protein B [Thermoplasmatales archaeon]
MSVIIGFYGESNTGKTTVIEKIIEELVDRGYKVAAVKITDKSISLDKEGKDTWRYSESGSKIVSLVSPIETSLLFKYPMGITTLMR